MSADHRPIELVMTLRRQGIADTRVLGALERTPREVFVDAPYAASAWENAALPIACGQTISQPFVVAYMPEALELGEKHRVTIDAMNTLGEMYILQFKYALAEPLLAKALELSRRVVGEDHFQTRQLEGMAELSMLYFNQSKFEQAESLATETFELSRRVMGEDHPSTSIAISYLGTMYSRHGQFARAEPLLIKRH